MLSRRRLMMASSTSVKGSVNGIIQDDWKTIGEICKKGPEYVKKYYKVGDVKPVPIDGEGTIDYEIIGIGVQDKADGTGKAAISWFPKSLLNSLQCWGSNSLPMNGWIKSELRTYMNNTLLVKYPLELQEIIVPVVNSNDYGGNTTDKIWALSKAEFNTGGIFYLQLGQDDQRIRSRNGSATGWGLRSVYSARNLWSVSPKGQLTNVQTCDSYLGIAPGFAT